MNLFLYFTCRQNNFHMHFSRYLFEQQMKRLCSVFIKCISLYDGSFAGTPRPNANNKWKMLSVTTHSIPKRSTVHTNTTNLRNVLACTRPMYFNRARIQLRGCHKWKWKWANGEGRKRTWQTAKWIMILRLRRHTYYIYIARACFVCRNAKHLFGWCRFYAHHIHFSCIFLSFVFIYSFSTHTIWVIRIYFINW